MTLDDTIRNVVQERASAPQFGLHDPADLASSVIRRGRRRKRREMAATSVLAVLAIAAAGTAATKLRLFEEKPSPIIATAPAAPLVPGKTAVPAYATNRSDGAAQWFVANPQTGQYRPVHDDVVAVSPDLKFVLLLKNEAHRSPIFSVYDVTTGTDVRKLVFPENTVDPIWSPDGRTIAFPHVRAENRADNVTDAVSFVDVTTGSTNKHELTSNGFDIEGLRGWAADGRSLLFGTNIPRIATFARVSLKGKISLVKSRFEWNDLYYGGTTIGTGTAEIIYRTVSEPVRWTVLDADSGDIVESYEGKEDPPSEQGAKWISHTHFAYPRAGQVLVLDLKSGKTTVGLTLGAKVRDLVMAPLVTTARTPAFSSR